jgi:hypothetical protein
MATISVSSSAELTSALAGAVGGETILLAAGDYSKLSLRDVSFGSAVTIQSADPGNMASFAAVELQGVNNLTFKNVIFDYESEAGAPIYLAKFLVQESSNISFIDSVFDGDLAHGVSDIDDGYGTGVGLKLKDSNNITISGNEFFDWQTGVTAAIVHGLTIENNDVTGIRTDGMVFNAIDGLVIAGNHFHDFRKATGSSDHADMIQFVTYDREGQFASQNVLIEGNFLNNNTGEAIQAIFMGNGAAKTGGLEMFYENITIRDNVIYGGHHHGISVGEVDGLLVENNTIIINQDNAIGSPGIKTMSADSLNVTFKNNVLGEGALGLHGMEVVEGNLEISYTAGEANYVGDLFVNALAGAAATLADLQPVQGGLIEQLGVGSSLSELSVSSTDPVDDTTTDPVDDTTTDPVDDTTTDPVDDTPTEPVDDTPTEPVEDTRTEPVDDGKNVPPGRSEPLPEHRGGPWNNKGAAEKGNATSPQDGGEQLVDSNDDDVFDGSRPVGSDSFVFLEEAGFTGTPELRYLVNAQGHAVVDGDTNRDGDSDFQVLVADTSLLSLDDFNL